MSVLDELFSWARSELDRNRIPSVKMTLVGAESSRNNLVSFGEGRLRYVPARDGGLFQSRPLFQTEVVPS